MMHRIERPIVSRLMRFGRVSLTTTPNNQPVQAHPKLEKVIKEMYKHTIPRLIVGDSWGDIAMINHRESQLRKQVAKGQDPIDALREMYRRQPPIADWERLVDDVAKVVGEYITIGIDAGDYIDFKSIDNRIEQTGGWMTRYPMGTSIIIPAQHSEEILNKLKEHRGIASIGGELTASGIEWQKKMGAFSVTRSDKLKLLKSTATTSQLGMFSSNNVPSFVVGNEGYKPPKNPPVNNDTENNCGV